MDLTIQLQKSVEENAGRYFDAAKKAKRKLEGAKKALVKSQNDLEALKEKEAKYFVEQQKKEHKAARKKEWYEKFHWFLSSEDFLCIGGKDATSNEIIVKKHTDAQDIVFHTDMAGSPFFVVKGGKDASQITLKETAQAVACYSKAWKEGHTTAEVFYVRPEQVSKEAKAGEHLAKGSFMITGKTSYIRPNLVYALGTVNDEVIGGPPTAIAAKTSKYVLIVPGRQKMGTLAKSVQAKIGGTLDEIMKFLPAGGGELQRQRK